MDKNKSKFEKIISIFGFVYLSIVFIFIGFIMDIVVNSIFKNISLLYKFKLFFFGFLIITFGFRLLFQNLPLSISEKFLLIGIKRRKIAIIFLVLSFFSIHNIIPFFVFLPFLIKNVLLVEGVISFLNWVVLIFIMTLILNYSLVVLSILFKKYMILLIAIFLFILISNDSINLYNFRYLSSFIQSSSILELSGIMGIVLIITFFSSMYLIEYELYLDKVFTKEKRINKPVSIINFSQNVSWQLFFIELKLIFRHSITRTYCIFGLVLTGIWSMLFYEDIISGFDFITYWYCVLIVISVFINYGQYLFAWESCYISFLYTNVSYKNILKSKYKLLSFFNILVLLVIIIFGFNNIIFFYQLAPFLIFNQGIGIYCLIYFSVFNSRGIDLSKGAFLNYESSTPNQVLIILFYLVLYGIISIPVLIFSSHIIGQAILVISGIAGIAFNKKIISWLTNHFYKRSPNLFIDLTSL